MDDQIAVTENHEIIISQRLLWLLNDHAPGDRRCHPVNGLPNP